MTVSNLPRSSISAFVVCMNEEQQIRRCLESVKWCDEVVVIDSGSTDGTLAIVREYTDKVFHREWTGYVDQKRYGLQQCSSDWVLNLDADEEVSVELKNEILKVLTQDKQSSSGGRRISGYFISRVVYFLGRWWRKGGWYPEYRLRLCRRLDTTWIGVDPHEKASVSGATARIKGDLLHYTYDSLADQVHRINTLSSNAADTIIKSGQRTSMFEIFIRPVTRVFKFYILKRGYREGFAGLIVAWLEGLQVFLKYAKVWESRYWNDSSPKSKK